MTSNYGKRTMFPPFSIRKAVGKVFMSEAAVRLNAGSDLFWCLRHTGKALYSTRRRQMAWTAMIGTPLAAAASAPDRDRSTDESPVTIAQD